MLYLAVLLFIGKVNAFNEMQYINTTEVNSNKVLSTYNTTEVNSNQLIPTCNITEVNSNQLIPTYNTTEVNSCPATEVCFYEYELFPACNLTEVNNSYHTTDLICNITELNINISKASIYYYFTVVDPRNNEPCAYCYIIEINDDKASFFCMCEKIVQFNPTFIEVIKLTIILAGILAAIIGFVISLIDLLTCGVIKKCLFSKPRH